MTTDNETWAFGHAVKRAIRDDGRMIIYEKNGDYAVRAAMATAPHDFKPLAEVYKQPDNSVTVKAYHA